MLTPLLAGLSLFLVQFFLCFLYRFPKSGLFFISRLKELIGTGRKSGHKLPIGKDDSLTALLDDDAFKFFYLLQFTLADFTCYLTELYAPDSTPAYYIDTINSFLVTTIAGLLSLTLSIQLGTLGCLQSLMGFINDTLVGLSLLAYCLLLLTLNIAVQGTACYGIGHSTHTVSEPSLLVGLLGGLLLSGYSNGSSTLHAKLLTRL